MAKKDFTTPLTLNGDYPNLDDRYTDNGNPYTSVSAAQTALASKLNAYYIGLTVLVKESGWTEAKEYWVQPKGTMPETYGLVEKGAGTTDYADLDNKPTINNVPLSGNKTPSDLGLATAEQGGKADTAIQGVSVNGTEVTPDPTTKKVALTIVNGKSAYQLYLDDYEDEHGSTDGALDEAAWLESLKAKIGGFKSVEYNSSAPQTVGSTTNSIGELIPSDATVDKIILMPNGDDNNPSTVMYSTISTESGGETTYQFYCLGVVSVDTGDFAQKAEVDTIKEWMSESSGKIELPSTRKYGWLSYDGANWYWNADASPLKTLIKYTVLSIGENGDIDPNAHLTLSADNSTVGYVRHRSTSGGDLLTVGIAYTFIRESVAFPSQGGKVKCTTDMFCDGYKPGSNYTQGNRPFKVVASGSSEDVNIPSDAIALVIMTNKCSANSTSASSPNASIECGTSVSFKVSTWPQKTFKEFSDEVERIGENVQNIGNSVEAINNNIDSLVKNVIDLNLLGTSVKRIYPPTEATTSLRGKVHNTNNWVHTLIDVSSIVGQKVVIAANNNYGSQVCFLTNTIQASKYNSKAAPFAGSASNVTVVPAGTESNPLVIPDDAKYLYVLRTYTNDGNVTDYTPTSVKIVGNAFETITELNEKNVSTDIFAFNKDTDVEPKLSALKYLGISDNKCVVIAHISDCHGYSYHANEGVISKQTWGRFVRFCGKWKQLGMIDEIVDTGDVVNSTYNNSLSWREDDEGITDTVITIPGNHDTYDGTSWQANVGVNVYNKLIKDNVEGWEVVQPQGAESQGKCYFYKDYTTHATATLRVLYLDCMGWNTEEKEWVEERLSECIENGYRCAIFVHFEPCSYNGTTGSDIKPIRCSFTSYNPFLNNTFVGYNASYHELGGIINTFQKSYYESHNVNGFVGYFVGHRHQCQIGRLTGVDGAVDYDADAGLFPQMVFKTENGGVLTASDRTSEVERKIGTVNQDSFQIVSINPSNGQVKLLKIGCNYTRYMQHRDVIAVSTSAYAEFDENKTDYLPGSIVSRAGQLWKLVNPVIVLAYTDWLLTGKVKYERQSGDETTYQEFDSAIIYSTNAIVSKDGELWKLTSPYVVSVHTDWAASDKEPYSRVISE